MPELELSLRLAHKNSTLEGLFYVNCRLPERHRISAPSGFLAVTKSL
jgi:hypothetical protein